MTISKVAARLKAEAAREPDVKYKGFLIRQDSAAKFNRPNGPPGLYFIYYNTGERTGEAGQKTVDDAKKLVDWKIKEQASVTKEQAAEVLTIDIVKRHLKSTGPEIKVQSPFYDVLVVAKGTVSVKALIADLKPLGWKVESQTQYRNGGNTSVVLDMSREEQGEPTDDPHEQMHLDTATGAWLGQLGS